MRAVVLEKGRLEGRETADPVPGPGQLLLRVVSTAICASDVHFMEQHDAVPAGGLSGLRLPPGGRAECQTDHPHGAGGVRMCLAPVAARREDHDAP